MMLASISCAFIACSSGAGQVHDSQTGDTGGAATEADASETSSDQGPSAPDRRVPEDDSGSAASDAGRDAAPDASVEPFDCAVLKQRTDTDAPPQSASWRYGGGHGYPDAVPRVDECMTVVATRAELEAALDTAAAGDIVYVDDDARIDLTGPTLCIPGGVWLVSGRGVNGSAGGLLYGTEIVGRPLLRACGPNVRLSGVRLWGPDPSQCPPQWPNACEGEDRTGGRNCRDCMPRPSGIATSEDNLEVDNCEIAGFTLAGVALSDSVGHRVHHNHLHHNQRQGLGYGVLLSRGQTGTVEVLVDFNRMDAMRHAIAGSGEPGQDYIARDNLVLPPANGHIFDMHGENENTDNGSELAGGEILIHRNTILVPDHYAMVIRGRPQTGAWLYDNCLARANPSQAALQRFFTGNFYIDRSPSGSAPNDYGQQASDCEPVRWCTSSGGAGSWRYLARSSYPLARLAIGDFDGDGVSDVFTTADGKWRWVSGGTGAWEDLNTSSVPLDVLRFGDFDGDGKTDAFNANGSEWRFSSGARGNWQTLREDTRPLSALRFGDFDGDGTTDVFFADGTNWRWSSGGTAAPAVLNVSSAGVESLAFGDFDGDGRTDVFSTGGGEWRWSRSGSSRWAVLNTSGVSLANLRFADFDGDGKTDVVRASRDRWHVSWGGVAGWETLRIDGGSVFSVDFGDFDGDGASDIFRTGCL